MYSKVSKFLEQSNAIEGVYDADSLVQAGYAWEFITKEKELTVNNIKKTHKILMLHQPLRPDERGYFRQRPVYIGGKEATKYYFIKEYMKAWLLSCRLSPEHWKLQHIEYEKIHPFIDGNGRTGRIFMNWQRIKAGLPILVIEESKKQDYYKWFDQSNKN